MKPFVISVFSLFSFLSIVTFALTSVITSLSFSTVYFTLFFLFSWDFFFFLQSVLGALAEVISLRFLNGVGPRTGIMGIDYSTALWLYKYVNLIIRTKFLNWKRV